MRRQQNTPNIQEIVKRICFEHPSEHQLIEFIHWCIHISYQYLLYLKTRGYQINDHYLVSNDQFYDVAVDAIAELFSRDETGKFSLLKDYCIPISQEDSQKKCQAHLERLIISRTRQSLSRIFKERDPEGAKIIARIKETVKNNPDYKTVDDFRGHLVIREQGNYINPAATVKLNLTVQDECALFQEFRPVDNIPQIMGKTFDYLEQRMKCFPAIEMGLFVRLIRTYRRSVESIETDKVSTQFPDESRPYQDDLSRQGDEALRRICLLVEHKYIKTKKVNDDIAQGFIKSLTVLSEDLVNCRELMSNRAYLLEQIPLLEQNEQYEKIAAKFDYLVRLLKFHWADFWVENSG